MNHRYRVVFNQTLGVMQAVSENSRSRGKHNGRRIKAGRSLSTAALVSALAWGSAPGLADAETIDGGQKRTVTDGNTWNLAGRLWVGDQSRGTLTITNGGAVNGENTVLVGNLPGSSGIVHVQGNNSAFKTTSSLTIGYEGAGELLIDDGASVEASSLSLGANPTGHGEVRLQGSAAGRGAMDIQFVQKGSGNARLVFDGGILRAKQHDHDFMRNFAPGDIQLDNGGAYIDTNGFNIGISAPLSGADSLTKQGAGTLVLSADNTYEGGTRLLDGVLSVASDTSLGAAHAALELDGGTLRITESSFGQTNRDVSLDENGGRFDMEFNSDLEQAVTFNGSITGPGRLVKTGRGNLRLAGDNAYGSTLVSEGELIGNSRSISGNVHITDHDTAAVTFVETDAAQFAGNISGPPSTGAAASKEGAGTLTLTGTSSVNWFIEEGELVTSAGRFLGYAATGPDGAVTFHETGDAALISAVLGMGRVNKTGEGTLRLLGDSSTFMGHTTVNQGTLSVGGADGAGRLGGTLVVGAGGTLSGTGQVGTTTIQRGGTVAPGASIGALSVAGDLTFEPGSFYHVEVDPAGSEADHINVDGTVSLQGGSVVHVGANGAYAPHARYRILSADTALTGSFDQVTSNLAFLTPSLAYDYENHTVDLQLQRNSSSFESFAHTPNQRATASGLASLPGDDALHQRILNLPDEAPAAVFDSLSGEAHASVVSALQASGSMLRTLPLAHMRTNLSAGLLPGAPLAQSTTQAVPASGLPQSAARPLWAEVVGSWRTMDSDGNAAGLKHSMGGLFVGGDVAMGAGWRLGTALGYTDAKLRIDDRDSKADIATYSAAAYAGKAFELETGRLNLMLGGAYSRHSIDSRRHTSVADWNHTLKADYHAHTYQLFGELGYEMSAGVATIEPFAGLAWTDVRARGFTESGGPTALSASSQSHDATTSTLGVRAGTGFELRQFSGRVHATAAWRHAFGGTAPQRTLAFEGGQAFTVAGAPIARDTALLELAADIALSSNATAGLSYGAQLGGGNREHAGKAYVQWRF